MKNALDECRIKVADSANKRRKRDYSKGNSIYSIVNLVMLDDPEKKGIAKTQRCSNQQANLKKKDLESQFNEEIQEANIGILDADSRIPFKTKMSSPLRQIVKSNKEISAVNDNMSEIFVLNTETPLRNHEY